MLAEAFPSCPVRPPIYSLDIIRRDPLGDKEITGVSWCTLYAARKFLEIILDEDDFVLETTKILRTESGIVVRCSDLKEIIEYEYTKEEANWDLPEGPHRDAALWIRQPRSSAPQESSGQSKRQQRLERKAQRSPGMLTIGELAEEVGMIPRDARAILRSKKIEKPPVGWAWRPDDAEAIRKILHEGK